MEIRVATEKDCKIIGELIKGIAEYEKLSEEVIWNDKTLFRELFIEKNAKVLLGEENNEVIGFALYFFNFSTFVGRKGLYLEDFYIKEQYRGRGYGKQFFQKLITIAKNKNCGRIEWLCLDWNENAKNFYQAIGAEPLNDWTTFRLIQSKYDEALKIVGIPTKKNQ